MTFKRAFRLGLLASASLCAMAVPSSAAAISAGIAAASAFLASGTLAAAAANAVISAGLAYGSSLLSAALTKKPKAQGGTLIDVQFAADVYRSIPFGRVALGGRRIYWKGVGKKNGRICIVDALGDWACEGLVAVWVNGVRKTLNPITVVGTEDARYEVEDYDDKFVVKFFSGTMGQSADSELITLSGDTDGGSIGAWTSDHRGAGVCYVSYILEYDDDLMPSEPRLLWELDGALLYDWRLDSTNGGTGSHRWDDPTTWEFSANPAVASYNYRRGFFRNGLRIGGIGVPSYDLLHDAYTTAANICDETVSDGGGNRDRYVVSFISNDDAEHRVAIDTFNGAMAGDDIERGGQFGVLAGAAYSPVMTLTDDDMIEGEAWTYRDKVPINALYNAVHVSWLNPAQPWSSDTLTPLTDSGYETEDGGTRTARDIDLPMVPNAYQARAIGKIELEKSRMQASHSGTYVGATMVLQPGDWVTRTFNLATSYGVSDLLDEEIYGIDMDFLTGFYLLRNGPDSLTMRVKSKRRVGAERYQIDLEQAATATYTGPTGGITVPSAPTITRPNIDPDAPSGLTATGLPGAVLLKWTNPTADTFDQIEVWEASTNDRSGASLLGTQRSTSLLRSPLNAGTTRYYWIRALDLSSRVSAWHPTGSTSGVSGSAGSIAGADASVFEVVASLPTLPDAGYPDGITVNLTPPGTLYSNIGGTWVQATPLLAVDELSALSARMGTLVAGKIVSPNYAEDGDGIPTDGFEIDADNDSVKARNGVFADILGYGAEFTRRPVITSVPSFKNGVEEGQGLSSIYRGETAGVIFETTSVNLLAASFRRSPYSIEFFGRAIDGSDDLIPTIGSIPVAPGSRLPARVTFANRSITDAQVIFADDGSVVLEELAGNGSVSATRQLPSAYRFKWISPLEIDPLNLAAASTVVGFLGIARRPLPFVVPTCSSLTFKLWGAAGGYDVANTSYYGGPGAYATGTMDVGPNELVNVGDILWIVIGEGGEAYRGESPLGFGGRGQRIGPRATGGGLTGVFRHTITRANAILIAGGGGAGTSSVKGSPGGHTTWAGGQSGSDIALMTGREWIYESSRSKGAGGGGYTGGIQLTNDMSGADPASGFRGGKGGTSFGHADLTSVTLSFSAADANGYASTRDPPNTGDSDYIANQYCWMTDSLVGQGNSNPAFSDYTRAGDGLAVITITP